MNILIATDKFKGSLTAIEAADAIAKGLKLADPECAVTIAEMADGGEGSFEIVKKYRDAVVKKLKAKDPLGREVETEYLIYEAEVKCAFIEMAKISGLEMLKVEERNPLKTTTFGLGELILDACSKRVDKIQVSIGGSATNDGGVGMLQALGARFYDNAGALMRKDECMCGGDLGMIAMIDVSHLINLTCQIEVICDVNNPLLGDKGATYIYAPQKGASNEMLQLLESGMKNYVDVLPKELAKYPDFVEKSLVYAMSLGAGAAGGVGYAMSRFLNANSIRGWEFFSTLQGLESKIASSDLVITGEGKIDEQSFCGKVVDGVTSITNKYSKPVLLFCGKNECCDVKDVYELSSIEPDLDRSIHNASLLLIKLAEKAYKEHRKRLFKIYT